MKKLSVVALLFLFALNLQAQWYNRTYGVDQLTDLSEKQLNLALQQAERNLRTGRIMTIVGVSAEVVGLSLVYSSFCIFDCTKAELVRGNTGGVLFLAGFITMLVGIPMWAVNGSRRNKIEIALVNLSAMPYPEIPHTYLAGFNQFSAPGISLKFRF